MISNWKAGVAFVISVVMSALGIKPAFAIAAVPLEPATSDSPGLSETQIAQTCEFGDKPKPFARVVTQRDPLRVRSSPNGRIIGSIPKGWAVVVVRKDLTGRWVRVASHFGEVNAPIFGSAPNFRSGWVAANFLQDIGTHCEKPMATSSLIQADLLGDREAVIQEDWIELGDSFAVPQRGNRIANTPIDP